MHNNNMMKMLLAMTLLMLPALALAQPNITSISPTRTSANTGATVNIYGTGFGSLSDLVYFPDSTGPHVVNPIAVIGGGVRVRVPETWSGDVRIQANGSGALSNGVPLEISFNYSSTKWLSLPFTWYLNSNGAPGVTYNATRDALVRGYDAWECASGLTTTFGGSTTTATTANDGENCRYWRNTGWSPGTIAVCSWWYYPGEIIEADIAFNSQHYTWDTGGSATDMDVMNVGIHEEGHSIGLLDMYGALDSDKTMYGYGGDGNTNARTLHTDDALGVEYMYPHSRANFAATTPAGWSGPLVPRNTNDGTSSYAPLPSILNGNGTTYINAAGINNGGDCASPSGLNHLFIDDAYVWWNSWSGVWGTGSTVTWPNSGPSIRGGRHTLKYVFDVNEETLESSEGDNTYQVQYVWSPYVLANQTPLYRSAPPARGGATYPNCDGFAMSTGGTYWACVGILPTNSSDDYDVRIHSETPVSTNGFDTFEASSGWGSGSSDFVLVNGNNAGGSSITRWAGVNRYSGGASGVYVQHSQNLGTLSAPVTTSTQTIHANDIVNVHEIYIGTATSWDFTLDNLSGVANLGFAVYDAAGSYYSKSNYAAYSNSGGNGADESFTYVAPATGYYGVVVFKTGTADLGDANTYQLNVQLTPPNLKYDAATGWDYPVVVRNDTGAASGNVHVSAALDGNTANTYLNISGINDGPNPAPSNHTRLYVDNIYIRYVNWGVINAGQRYQFFNTGPHNVRGGRHMVAWNNDWNNEVPETNESDNLYRRQFVWSPLALSDQVPLVRTAPPAPGYTEGFIYPNCDGFEFTWGGYWGAVGILPTYSGDDYDVRLHDDPVTPGNGFDSYFEASSYSAGLSDFVLVNGNNAGGSTGTRQAGVMNWSSSGGSSVAVQQSNRVALLSPPASLVTQTLAANAVVAVYEIYFSAATIGSYTFELDQTAGTANLGFSLFDQAGTTFSKSDYIAMADASGNGGDESFNFEISNPGYYGLVVWKRGSADHGKSSTFDLHIGLTPPNLVPYAGTGWDYPVVARNDNTATNGNAHVSAVLDGNTNNTYLSQCGINDGPNPAPLNHTRYYLDGVYVWWLNYGAINPGSVYFGAGSGPLNIRGGRHSIEWVNDWDNLVPELNELDNSYLRQFVWSPLLLADETPLSRSAPPQRGVLANPNSDGFYYTGSSDRAWASALCPDNAGDDFDLVVYSDYSGAQSGFSSVFSSSGKLAGLVDYAGGSRGTGGTTHYPACILYAGGVAGYTQDAADSGPGHLGTTVPVYWTDETLPNGRLVDVYEVNLVAGSEYFVELENRAGGADLVVDVQPPSATAYNWATAEFSWDGAVAGGDEGGAFTPAENGRYVFVVHKKSSGDKALAVTYDFAVLVAPSAVGDGELPTVFALKKNAPNPFNPMTMIKYELPEAGRMVRLEIFNISGKRVRTLVSETQSAGFHEVVWDGKSDSGEQTASGVYFYRLQAGNFSRTEKMTLIK
jgi:FlgD Ig-like domain/IPT/TIG domain/Matrixin